MPRDFALAGSGNSTRQCGLWGADSTETPRKSHSHLLVQCNYCMIKKAGGRIQREFQRLDTGCGALGMPAHCAHSRRQMAQITLRVIDGADRGRVYERETPISIGREEGNSIQLNDDRISRFHIKVQDDHASDTRNCGRRGCDFTTHPPLRITGSHRLLGDCVKCGSFTIEPLAEQLEVVFARLAWFAQFTASWSSDQ